MILILFFLILSNCAPKLKHPPLSNKKSMMGPIQSDIILKFNESTHLYEKLPNIQNETYLSSDLFNTIENLLKLSELIDLPQASKLADEIQKSIFKNSKNFKSVSFEISPFADAALLEAQPPVNEELDLILTKINFQLQLVSQTLDQNTQSPPQNAKYPLALFTKIAKERILSEVYKTQKQK